MKFALIVVTVLLIGTISSTCMAITFTQKTGPFTIQVTSDEAVGLDYVADPYPMDNFNAYDVDLYVGNNNVTDSWEIEIQDYGRPINIDLQSAIIKYDPSWNELHTSWESPTVGGKPGLIGIIAKGGADKNVFLGPWPRILLTVMVMSTTLVIIDAVADVKNFTEDKTMFENVVKDIRVLKTG